MDTSLAVHLWFQLAAIACASLACAAESGPPTISEAHLPELMVVVEFDRERQQLRSGKLLDFRLETDRNAYWKRTASHPDWDRSHKFLVPRGSPFKAGRGARSLLLLEDFFGYGGVGSYLSVWSVVGDSLQYECMCPESFSGGLSGAEILAVVEAPDAMYVLTETMGWDGGDGWGGLQVHLVQDCGATLYFDESWEADYACLSGAPVLDYDYVPEMSTDSLIVVLAKSQVCKANVLKPDREREIRIPLGDASQTH